ncbi:MAG TPA: hypothetical protein VGN90_02220 [Pyrinomonadaceae bacterium]|jgi:hypothetical protein|nr:hypothetical protein [Pyrinomonadaceae bacterium]
MAKEKRVEPVLLKSLPVEPPHWDLLQRMESIVVRELVAATRLASTGKRRLAATAWLIAKVGGQVVQRGAPERARKTRKPER